MGINSQHITDISDKETKMDKIQFEKHLRQKIMAITVAKLGWDKEFLHNMMENWGFGNSLRALDAAQLIKLKRMLFPKPESYYDPKFQYDDQGKYMYYLLRSIGWNMKRLQGLIIKKYNKTHWNILSTKEKRGVINMLKRYGRSKKNERTKR